MEKIKLILAWSAIFIMVVAAPSFAVGYMHGYVAALIVFVFILAVVAYAVLMALIIKWIIHR